MVETNEPILSQYFKLPLKKYEMYLYFLSFLTYCSLVLKQEGLLKLVVMFLINSHTSVSTD